MLRSIQSTAFLGTILLSGVALAKKPAAPASDDTLIESGKPGAAAPAATPVEAPPAAATPAAAIPAEGAAPVALPIPTPVDEPEMDAPKAAKKRSVASAGLDTQAVTVGSAADVGDSASDKDWGFKFKGFFRAPMRVGISRSVPPKNTSPDVHANDLQFHATPVTPDHEYTRWSYTNISPGPWAELLFQYGNQRVMMTTSIASYNITSGGWRELQDQLGIDRAFLTLKFPEALGNLGGMSWDVGIFSNRYGAMGKYDAGEYETYLIGRTRAAGATATMDMEVSDEVKVIVEGGVGAKVDQQYQTYNSSGTATYDYPSWQPYPGDSTQQGSNVLAHLHAGLVIDSIWTLQAHYIGSFVRDARWNVGTTGGSPNAFPSGVPGSASIQVGALDLKLDGGWRGDGYIGYSYVKAKNALAVNDTIELLHSQGGWQLAHNFFQDGNGAIHSAVAQYTFSLAAFMMRPRPFWGQAADLTVRVFGMFNDVTGTTGGHEDVKKLKYGADTIYSFMPMMAAGLRLDAVNPDMNDSTKSFYVISPKLIFRSEFVTHEQVVLQYSYYAYGSSYTDSSKSDSVMPWPFGQYGTLSTGKLDMKPDHHVITLYANMWW